VTESKKQEKRKMRRRRRRRRRKKKKKKKKKKLEIPLMPCVFCRNEDKGYPDMAMEHAVFHYALRVM